MRGFLFLDIFIIIRLGNYSFGLSVRLCCASIRAPHTPQVNLEFMNQQIIWHGFSVHPPLPPPPSDINFHPEPQKTWYPSPPHSPTEKISDFTLTTDTDAEDDDSTDDYLDHKHNDDDDVEEDEDEDEDDDDDDDDDEDVDDDEGFANNTFTTIPAHNNQKTTNSPS